MKLCSDHVYKHCIVISEEIKLELIISSLNWNSVNLHSFFSLISAKLNSSAENKNDVACFTISRRIKIC